MENPDFSFVPGYPGVDLGESIPPRSRLFSLEPIGVGTSEAEGLTSYIIRLAEAHSVSPCRLIREGFAKLSPEIAKYQHTGRFFSGNPACINGLHRYSESFADIVEDLCGLSAARNLTLLPLKALLPFNGVGMSSKNSRWCPACYADMRRFRQETYQPLAWSLDLYQVCPRHGKTMIDRCPSCDNPQHLIPPSPIIGYCNHCGTWLGKSSDKPPPATPFEMWIATAIEEIITALPRIGSLATRDRFLSQLKEAINRLAGGSRREFCRKIGLPDAASQIWISGGRRPSLARWLAISYGIGIGPVRFLEQQFLSFSESTALRKLPCTLPPRAVSPQLTVSRRQGIEAELDCIAKAGNGLISVTALAERYGLARHNLQSLWPNQCTKISSDYREKVKTRWNEELQRKCSLTRETVDSLLERGCYPSQNIVREALDRIGISMANPVIRATYKQHLKKRLGDNEIRS